MNAPSGKTSIGWVGLGVTVLVTVLGAIFHSQNQQADQLSTLVTQNAVITTQLTVLATQMSNVPAMQQQITVLIGQTNRNTDDIKELRGRMGK